MRTKYLVLVAVAFTLFLLVGCGAPLPPSLRAAHLTWEQKATVAVWYHKADAAQRQRIEHLTEAQVTQSVDDLTALCALDQDRRSLKLTESPWLLDQYGADALSDAIGQNLCSTAPRPTPHANPFADAPQETLHPAPDRIPPPGIERSPQPVDNPRHDLDLPAGRYDREDATTPLPDPPDPHCPHHADDEAGSMVGARA